MGSEEKRTTVKADTDNGVKSDDRGQVKIKKRQLEEDVINLDNLQDQQAMDIEPPKRLKFTPGAEMKNARPRRNGKGDKAGNQTGWQVFVDKCRWWIKPDEL